MNMVGRKIKIVDKNNPHCGETGIVESIEKTICGYGLLVKLDDCPMGIESCFVFSSEEFEFV